MFAGLCPRLLVPTLVLAFASTLAACDSDEPTVEITDVQTFDQGEQGVMKTSDDGAFRVVLTSEAGLAVGPNALVVRLGFEDPNDPSSPGRGIPAADVALSAWMPQGDGAVDGIRGEYLGDGRYAVDVEFAEPGIWQLDFDLAVGDGIDDSVSFAFVVGEPLVEDADR